MFKKFYGKQSLLDSLIKEEKKRLFDGKAIARGTHTYQVCSRCSRVIRTNGFFGSIHVCK